MSRVAKQTTAFFSFVGLAIVVAIVALAPRAMRASAAAGALPPGESRSTLIRAGLSPDALAAAGLSVAQASSAIHAARMEIAANPTRLTSADEAYVAARQAHDALARKIESGQATQQEIASYPSMQAALTTAETNRQAAVDAVFAAGTQSLGTAQRAVLTQIRANHDWELPVEFLTVERTEPAWVALRDALSNERISAKHEQPANPQCQSLLATARSNAAVAAARSASDANLAAVTSAWDAGTSN